VKAQNGKKFDYYKIKDLLNSKNRNTGKLLNNFKMKMKNKKKFSSQSENVLLTDVEQKTERFISEYENQNKETEEDFGVPVLNNQNAKIKTICQIKISNLNKIDDDNNSNRVNNTISSCRNNVSNKIKYHYFKNDSVNSKIYSNYNKNALKRFKVGTVSNSFKALDYNRNDNKIKIKYSYTTTTNNVNNANNNNIINQNNITNYINNINNNFYIDNSNSNNNNNNFSNINSYVNTEVKVYKKKFSFRKKSNRLQFNNDENSKKGANKSQNIESIDNDLKTRIKKLQFLKIPKINSKLKDKLKQKPKFNTSQKNKAETESD
jgi:hypothetical protein